MFRTLLIGLLTASPVMAETLRIGASPDYPPYISTDPAGARIGLDVDLADAICALGDYDCVWVDLPVGALIPALTAGRIDLIMGGIGYSPARDALVDFTCPYYATPNAQVQIYTRTDSAPLKTARIGVVEQTLHALAVQNAGYNAVLFPDSAAAIAAYVAGKVDGFAGTADVIASMGTGSAFVARHALPTPTTGAAIAVSENRPDLRTTLDRHLATISADGRLGQMQLRWMFFDQGDVIADCQTNRIGA